MSKRKRGAEPLDNLIVVSDLHVGCQVGLIGRNGARLDEGGEYRPNCIQRQMLRWWDEFWGEWVPGVTRGEPFGVVVNGDILDAVHHNSVTQWSHNLADQVEAAIELLVPIVRMCGGRFWIVRGTEAHAGKSCQEEERLAARLGAIPNAEGQHARHELWKYVGPRLVHFQHHIGTTSSMAYESTGLHKELIEAFVEAGRWEEKPPDCIVRSHRHRCLVDKIPSKNVAAWGVVTPGWQAKTPFAYRIAGCKQQRPQFGGVLVRHGDQELYVREWVRALPRAKAE